MYEKLLKECGLTQNESLIYLALLKIGKAKSGEIVRASGISGGKIYETLYKLIDKGLVKSVSENKVKNFIANEPSTLISYIKEKEKLLHEKEHELEKIIPELKSMRLTDKKLETVSLIKGFRGIREIIYSSLEKSKSIKIMGVTSKKDEKYNNFWMNWHRERIKLKKKAKILFSERNNEYWDFFRKSPYTELKEMLHFTPSAIMMIDDNSFIYSYDEEFTCIHILSKPISDSFSSFFDDLWAISK